MSDASIWICPGCSRKFRLPAGKKPPRQCQTCQQAAPSPPPAPVIDESSFLADLAAVAPPPVTTPSPADPGPAPGFVRIVPAEIVREEDLKGAIRRDKLRRRLIVGGIIATAAGLLIGFGVVLASYFSGPYRMPNNEIYGRVCEAVRKGNNGNLEVRLGDWPTIERDVAHVDGRWLSLVHSTFTVKSPNGLSVSGPWSAIVSVDHANRAVQIELKVLGSEVDTESASDWFLHFYDGEHEDPVISDLHIRAVRHGKSPDQKPAT